jgi:ectoine hydroxylase-related dioxygenase (phytanoyl-CoA dioxygenase family)
MELTGQPRISDNDIDYLISHGYVVIKDFLSPEELKSCRLCLSRYYPSPEKYFASPERYKRMPRYVEFPFSGEALNMVSVHPELISFIERLLGTTELRLAESRLQAKYAGRDPEGGSDELMHCDGWGPNQLVYPRDDSIFRQVPMILYYTDVTAKHGPTYVVPQELAKGHPLLSESPTEGTAVPWVVHSPEAAPRLYADARPVLATAGSLLVMSPRTFHRGSTFLGSRAARVVHFITYRASAASWMCSQGWSPASPRANTAQLQEFIVTASPRQREMLGFPPPGHPYWNDEMIAGVAVRYPGIDMDPYTRKSGAVGRPVKGTTEVCDGSR